MNQRDMTRLEARLRRIAARRGAMPAPQVLVVAPGVRFAFGDQERPFHTASVGKLMTATLIAMLAERGRLDFDTPVGKLLPQADLAGLPAEPGVDVPADVTVEHLLTHTSGLPDYFEPPRGSRTRASMTTMAADPDRRWTPAELLDEVRSLPPVGRPGGRFHYSDTGYVLLGRIAEEATGATLATSLRELIFAPSGMTRSSMPYADARPEDLDGLDVAPFWIGGSELSRALAVSLDWAGGGIVATLDDLVRFQQALHGGRLISSRSLERLTRPRHRFRRGIHYGAGAMTVRFGEFLPPFLRGLPQPVGHIGVLATHMFHYPGLDAHVVLNFHSTRQMNRSFTVHSQIAQLLVKPR